MAAIDERLAPLFRIGLLALSLIASSSVSANAEIAAGVKNLTGDYVDFNDVNILSRRACLSVAAEF